MRVLCVMILAAAATPAVHGAVVEIRKYNDTNCTESFICDVDCNVPREEAQDRILGWRETINGTLIEKFNATCKGIPLNYDVCLENTEDVEPFASYRISCKEDEWVDPTSVSRIDVCFLNETCHPGLNEHVLNDIEEFNMTHTLYAEETNIPVYPGMGMLYIFMHDEILRFLNNSAIEDVILFQTITAYDKFCIYQDVPVACPATPSTVLCEANDNSTLDDRRHNFRATCRDISPATATPSFTPTLTQTLTQTSTPTSTQSLTQTSTPTSTQSSTPTSTYTTSTSTTSTTTTTTVFEKSRRVHMFVPIVATGGFVLAFVGSALA